MKNTLINKVNAPYIIAGSLATLALLTSGVFAAAPYVAFLAPVAALNFGLPFAISCAVFSLIIVALSYAAASQNKVITAKTKEIKDQSAELINKAEEIKVQKEEIARKTAEIETMAEGILTNPKSTISCKHRTTVNISCVSGRLLLNLDEEQKELVRKSKNQGKKTEYLLYVKSDKGVFRITGTYEDNFPINSVANQDGSDVQNELMQMGAKLGVDATPQNVEVELKIEGEIHRANIRIKVESVVPVIDVSHQAV